MRGVHVTVSINKGTNIQQACDSAKEISERIGQEIVFKFNGVEITTENKSIKEMVESYTTHRGF